MLQHAAQGDAQAAESLIPLIYNDLRKMAHVRLRGAPGGQTLQPTALVHEAYVKLLGTQNYDWPSRRCFFAAAARAMRDVLVDAYRRRSAAKRGGGWGRVDLDLAIDTDDRTPEVTLAIDTALEEFEAAHPRATELVRLRFFAGLTLEEAAAVLEISDRTAKRDWQLAKAWLRRALSASDE